MLSGDEGALPLALMLDVTLLREIDFHGLRRLVPGVPLCRIDGVIAGLRASARIVVDDSIYFCNKKLTSPGPAAGVAGMVLSRIRYLPDGGYRR
jgi:hypothetical protein